MGRRLEIINCSLIDAFSLYMCVGTERNCGKLSRCDWCPTIDSNQVPHERVGMEAL